MMPLLGMSLSNLVETADSLHQVEKTNLHRGDCVFVKTHNSIYTVKVLDHGWFEVSGGWFDKKGVSPARVQIHGCTWGGKAIKIDVVAACGLCLEFGNRVVTSPVQRIIVFQNGIQN